LIHERVVVVRFEKPFLKKPEEGRGGQMGDRAESLVFSIRSKKRGAFGINQTLHVSGKIGGIGRRRLGGRMKRLCRQSAPIDAESLSGGKALTAAQNLENRREGGWENGVTWKIFTPARSDER